MQGPSHAELDEASELELTELDDSSEELLSSKLEELTGSTMVTLIS